MMTSKGALAGVSFNPSCFSNAEKMEGPAVGSAVAGESVATPFRVTGPVVWQSGTHHFDVDIKPLRQPCLIHHYR